MTGGPDAALASFFGAQKFGWTAREGETPKKLRRAARKRAVFGLFLGMMWKYHRQAPLQDARCQEAEERESGHLNGAEEV